MKEEHILFILKPVDNFASMILKQISEQLIEKYLGTLVSKAQFYYYIKEQCTLNLTKLEKFSACCTLDKNLLKGKLHFNHG